jgi:hypothetical protein
MREDEKKKKTEMEWKKGRKFCLFEEKKKNVAEKGKTNTMLSNPNKK